MSSPSHTSVGLDTLGAGLLAAVAGVVVEDWILKLGSSIAVACISTACAFFLRMWLERRKALIDAQKK